MVNDVELLRRVCYAKSEFCQQFLTFIQIKWILVKILFRFFSLVFRFHFISTLLIICILNIASHTKFYYFSKSLINFVHDLTNEPYLLINVNNRRRKATKTGANDKFIIGFEGYRRAGLLTAVLLIANFILWLINQVDGKGRSHI